MAKKTYPLSRNSAAYFALIMFTADLDAAYDAGNFVLWLFVTKSRSPAKLEIVATFFADPFSRRGRKAFTSTAAPMTFVWNYGRVSFPSTHGGGEQITHKVVELFDEDVLLADTKKIQVSKP